VLFFLLACVLTVRAPADAQLVGEEAPPFQAADLEGKSINLGAVLGKQPVLLVFWASW
jgi:peroxiredoxin